MENLGYKEGLAKPRRLTRLISTVSKTEAEEPLVENNNVNRLKPIPPNLMVTWANNSDVVIETPTQKKGEFEYMECGPSPEAESAPHMYDSYEEYTSEFSEQLRNDTLRINIIDQMRSEAGRVRFLDDIEQCNVIAGNLKTHFESASQIEKNLSYLWAAFLKRWDLLEGFLEIGAELNFADQNGISALHLGAFNNCLSTLSFLVDKDMDVNLQPNLYTPLHCAAFGNSVEAAKFLINNGALITIDTRTPICGENLLQCAVHSNALECLQLFIAMGADVNSLEPNGTNAMHLAADLGNIQCLRALLNAPNADPNIRICVSEKESTALHLAADEGYVECVDLLLAKGADAKLENHRGFTALHLAARTSSLQCVDSLLRNGNADPNAKDFDNRTPLHAAIGKSANALDILETLIRWGANIDHKDVYGFTALHLAALEGLTQCVNVLIYRGADITTKSKKGTSALNVITRKTPASVAMIRQTLDAAITVRHSQDPLNREVELDLDFHQLLQHCHPREIGLLNAFVDDGQKELLEHPLCTSFLYVKWEKIRKFYIGRLIFCFMFVLFLTLYVLTALAHNCYNSSKADDNAVQAEELCQTQSLLGNMLRNNPFVIEMQWWVLVAFTTVEIFRKLYGTTGYSSFKHYVLQVENIMEWFVITSVFAVSYVYTKHTYTFQNHVGAFAVLCGWTNLMLMVGQLPMFDVYVAMYTRVQAQIAKLMLTFLCLLIGFTISFCVIFPTSTIFSNPLMGFITILAMMIGELSLDMVDNDPDGKDPPLLLEVSAQIIYVLFLLFITIALMNLLVAIAVEDIKGLKKTAELFKLVRQTKLMSHIESALFIGYLPNCLRNILFRTALVSPQPHHVVLCVKPLNPYENRLPKEILLKAYEIGKQRKNFNETILTKDSSNAYLSYENNNNYKNQAPYPVANETLGATHFAVLTQKMDYNAAHTELLARDIQELKKSRDIQELRKMLISQQQQTSDVMEKLLTIIANQQMNLNK